MGEYEEMTYSERHVEGYLSDKAGLEVFEGEQLFAYELAAAFSPENIKNGVEIDFGTDQEAFEKAIAYLKLKEHVGFDLQVIQAQVMSTSRTTMAIDMVREVVSEVGLVRSLNILQAVHWDIDKESDFRAKLKVPDVAWTSLLLGQDREDESDGRTIGEHPSIAIKLIQKTRYEPALFTDDGDGEQEEFLSALDVTQENKVVLKKILNRIFETDGMFIAPSTSFAIKIIDSFEWGKDDWSKQQFIMKDGHIIPRPLLEGEVDEDFDWDQVFDRIIAGREEDEDDERYEDEDFDDDDDVIGEE